MTNLLLPQSFLAKCRTCSELADFVLLYPVQSPIQSTFWRTRRNEFISSMCVLQTKKWRSSMIMFVVELMVKDPCFSLGVTDPCICCSCTLRFLNSASKKSNANEIPDQHLTEEFLFFLFFFFCMFRFRERPFY